MNTCRVHQVIIPVTITLGVQALVSMVAVAVPIFMSVASGELNFSPSFVGIFVSLIYLGATASAPVSGYIVDRFGPILISQIGLLLCALGLALISSGSPFWMVCGALVIGSGYGPVTPASTNLLIKTTPLNMISLVFSIKQTGVPVGGALAGAVVPLLLLSYGWRTAAMGVAGLSLISTLAIQPFRKHYDNDRPEKIQFSWNQLIAPIMMAFSNQGLRPVVVASFFFATMQLSVISYIVSYLTQDIGMTLVRAGFMLSAAQFGGIIGRIFWGVIADRFLNSRIMLGILGIAMSATAFLLAMFSAQWSHSGILAVCILFGSVAIGWNGVYLAEVACSVKPKHTGMATGGSLFFTYCGVLIGLPVFSLIVDKTDSYPVGFFSTAICVGICGMILFFSRASHTRSYRIDS